MQGISRIRVLVIPGFLLACASHKMPELCRVRDQDWLRNGLYRTPVQTRIEVLPIPNPTATEHEKAAEGRDRIRVQVKK